MPTTELFGVVQTADQLGNLITSLSVPRGFAVGNGNNVVVAVSYGSTGETCTVTDDLSNTYTKRTDVTRGQRYQLWTCENVTNAPKRVIVNISGSGSSYLSVCWGEACGVGAYDSSHATTGTSTTPNAGSYTPANGALIFFSCVQDDGPTFLTLWTPNAGYTTVACELSLTFHYAQWKLHTSGATNPGVTMSASRGWSSGSISWVADTSKGTAPSSTVRPNLFLHNAFPASGAPTTPYKIQGPSKGHTRIGVLLQIAPGATITGITDTDGNTWTQDCTITNSAGGTNEFWSAPISGAGTDTNILSIAFSGSNTGNLISFIGFKNAGAVDASVTVTTSGYNGVSTSTVGATVTPSRTNGMLISLLGIDSETVISVNAGEFVSCLSTPTVGSPSPLMQDNGYAFQFPTTLSSIQKTWTTDFFPQYWEELNVFIKNITDPVTEGTLASSGTGTVTLTGQSVISGVLAASGVGAATFGNSTIFNGVLSADGIGAATLIGKAVSSGILAAAGVGTATFISNFPDVTSGLLATSGEGTATFVGASKGAGTLSIICTSQATFFSFQNLESYYRRYLNDRLVVGTAGPVVDLDSQPDNEDTQYFRKYLNDKVN